MRDNPMCIDGPLFRGRDKPPMTISEEEHVARAIQARRLDEDFSATVTLADGSKQWVVDHDAELARVAIAAIREREVSMRAKCGDNAVLALRNALNVIGTASSKQDAEFVIERLGRLGFALKGNGEGR